MRQRRLPATIPTPPDQGVEFTPRAAAQKQRPATNSRCASAVAGRCAIVEAAARRVSKREICACFGVDGTSRRSYGGSRLLYRDIGTGR